MWNPADPLILRPITAYDVPEPTGEVMKPTTKPLRTHEERAEEVAIRRRHAANPIRQSGRLAQSIRRASPRFCARWHGSRLWRESHEDLPLAEVAERMGIDAPALSRLETGKVLNPTLATLHKWAEAARAEALDIELSST